MLETIDFSKEKWDTLYKTVYKLCETLPAQTVKYPLPIVGNGITQIPIQNKEWLWLIGENPKCGVYNIYRPATRACNNRVLLHNLKPCDVPKLLEALIWNTLVCICLSQKTLHPLALYRTVNHAVLNLFRVPRPYIIATSEAIYTYCLTAIETLYDPSIDGYNNMLIIQGYFQNIPKFNPNMDWDVELPPARIKMSARFIAPQDVLDIRKHVVNQLLRDGVANLKTRKAQDALIVKAANTMDGDFKTNKSALTAYLRRLHTFRDGVEVPILINYTNHEKNIKVKQALKIRYPLWMRKERTDKRLALIMSKIDSGIALNSADRKWKCRHKKLFKTTKQ